MPLFRLALLFALATSTACANGEPASGPEAAAAPDHATACLPTGDGFLQARLRGAIEADLEWRQPELDCTGMLRPAGEGLRLRFSGPLPDGGRLALLFAPRGIGEGDSGRGLPLNVTVMHESEGRIYGTLGDGRCTLDELSQSPLPAPPGMARAWRVQGRGFCTEPARAVGEGGSLLLTRFDFAGWITVDPEDAMVAAEAAGIESLQRFPQSELTVQTARGRHPFRVWVADTTARRSQGLMFVRRLAPDRGMLFLFERPVLASFWMRNTYIPLDLLFVAADGRVVNIIENTEPFSLSPLESSAPVTGVLELPGGTAARLGIEAGAQLVHPAFRTRS